MSGRLKIWLLAIILLTIVAFQWTFRPFRFHKRRDPVTRVIIPPAAHVPMPLAKTLYVYPPVPELTLDLDLQGGMRVVLQAKQTATFEYLFTEKFAKNEAEALKVKRKLLAALPANSKGLGAGRTIETPQLDKVKIATRADSATVMNRQDRMIREVLRAQIGPDFETSEKSLTTVRDKLDQVVGIIERRVNKSGLSEARVRKQPPDKIVVEIPGVGDPQKALALIQKTAVLKFQAVPPDIDVQVTESGITQFYSKATQKQIPTKEVLDEAPVILTGADLLPKCEVGSSQNGGNAVLFQWKPKAGDVFRDYTSHHIKQNLAIVLDNDVISAPVIQSEIGARGQITGKFTVKEATNLADLLNAGALPVPLTEEETRVVSATLGQDSIHASLWAGLVGLLLVLLFMAAYYRLPGLLADFALIIYGLLILFVLRLFHATLTLPGIAGVIISLGMAVDANVIIFERLKEELRTGKTLKSAIEAGFNRAWTAILDSNVCSLLTGSVLWSLGTPAIKGFAITLIVGVAVSMFTAITITRLFVDITADTRAAQRPAWFGV
jgi:preprotein translocase subunit SecD